jgi:hypothetical protein
MLRDWRRRRRELKAEQLAYRRELERDYVDRLAAQDPDAQESARDFGDNDLVPWRTGVGLGLALIGFLALGVILVVLIGFFAAIKQATS